MPYDTVVEWKGQRVFEAQPPLGNKFIMDAHPELGGQNLGPTPLEAFISSLAACSAMDVISVLEKKRMTPDSYRIEISGERTPEGEFPRPFKSFLIRHVVTGNVDPEALNKAIHLSHEKYCTVAATVRANPEVTSVGVVE